MLTHPHTSRTASLLERFRTVRAATMQFCTPLTPEDMMVQSCAEASPVKWHLAHTSWFFETFVLSEFVAGYQPFDPNFRWLFNSYYRALGEMPEKKLRASFSRPPLDQILAYRRHVDATIERLLSAVPQDESQRRIVLGLEHEQQHLELAATDIKHAFFTNPLHPAYAPLPTQPAASDTDAIAPPLNWLSFTPGSPLRPGIVEIGLTPDPNDLHAFAFDNETPRHPVYLAPFQLASRAVTCAEYLAFIEDDGYSRPELWLSEGWDTLQAQGWQAPLYWVRHPSTPSGWSIFTLHGFQPLGALSETPVCHLSFFEADAYARWSGNRLPTEFEWEHVASHLLPQEPASASASGVAAGFSPRNTSPENGGFSPGEPTNMLEANHLHPTAASTTADPAHPQQLFGDVWEWTQSPYTGYPGYKPLPGALGEYNGKFMSSQVVLRGGSCVTPQSHIRATYRNFFSPSTRWQFSGLRLARDGA
ncbi:MAG: ergothioneine biosynthesis protein EgtB [Acidobacteriaceae bacterium]